MKIAEVMYGNVVEEMIIMHFDVDEEVDVDVAFLDVDVAFLDVDVAFLVAVSLVVGDVVAVVAQLSLLMMDSLTCLYYYRMP